MPAAARNTGRSAAITAVIVFLVQAGRQAPDRGRHGCGEEIHAGAGELGVQAVGENGAEQRHAKRAAERAEQHRARRSDAARIITLLVARENRWRLYADLARRAAVELSAPELWMLARLGERAPITLAALSAELNIPERELAPPLDALCARAIAEKTPGGALRLTPHGAAMRERIVAARRQGLADMLARWRPEQHPDVLALIEGMAQALTSDLPAPQAA